MTAVQHSWGAREEGGQADVRKAPNFVLKVFNQTGQLLSIHYFCAS